MSRIVAAMLMMGLSVSAFGFGNPGEGGYSGVGGHNGQNGEDVSILVDGRALELRLDGMDGTPGGDATNGEDASSCWFSPTTQTEYGAAGGSGGHGGEGGSGGRGGHATFFVKNKVFKKGSKVRFQVTLVRALETLSRGLQFPVQEGTL